MAIDRHDLSNTIARDAADGLGDLAPGEAGADVRVGTLPGTDSPLSGEARLTAQARLITDELHVQQGRERAQLQQEMTTLDAALTNDVPPADVPEAAYTPGQKVALGILSVVVAGLVAADVYILAGLVPALFNLNDAAWERFAIAGVPAAIALASADLAVEKWAESTTAVGANVRMRRQVTAGLAGFVVLGVGLFGMTARVATADNPVTGIDATGRGGFILFQIVFAIGTIIAAALLHRLRSAWQPRLRQKHAGLRDELAQMRVIFWQQQVVVYDAFSAALVVYRTELVRQTRLNASARVAWEERNARELAGNWLAHRLAPDLAPPDQPPPAVDPVGTAAGTAGNGAGPNGAASGNAAPPGVPRQSPPGPGPVGRSPGGPGPISGGPWPASPRNPVPVPGPAPTAGVTPPPPGPRSPGQPPPGSPPGVTPSTPGRAPSSPSRIPPPVPRPNRPGASPGAPSAGPASTGASGPRQEPTPADLFDVIFKDPAT